MKQFYNIGIKVEVGIDLYDFISTYDESIRMFKVFFHPNGACLNSYLKRVLLEKLASSCYDFMRQFSEKYKHLIRHIELECSRAQTAVTGKIEIISRSCTPDNHEAIKLPFKFAHYLEQNIGLILCKHNGRKCAFEASIEDCYIMIYFYRALLDNIEYIKKKGGKAAMSEVLRFVEHVENNKEKVCNYEDFINRVIRSVPQMNYTFVSSI